MIYYDVCIVGAGPAGIIAAKALAGFGYNVVLLEKEAKPKFNIGITLTPGIHHWLGMFDLSEAIYNAGFPRATNISMLWETTTKTEKLINEPDSGYHVDRTQFDEILIKSLSNTNVTLIRPCNVISANYSLNKHWQIVIKENQEKVIGAKFLVEATGRKRIIKGQKLNFLPKTTAIYGVWKTDHGRSMNESFIEAVTNGWIWGAPLKEDSYLVCVFAEPKDIQKAPTIRQIYDLHIAESRLMPSLTELVNLEVCSANASRDTNIVSDHHIKIGDSCYTQDPISSQGVQHAMRSGFHGAIVINTILSGGDKDAAIRFYKETVDREISDHKSWCGMYYKKQFKFSSDFWSQRVAAAEHKANNLSDTNLNVRSTDIITVSDQVVFKSIPSIHNNLVVERAGLENRLGDSFVYFKDIALASLISNIQGQSISNTLKSIHKSNSNADPLTLLRFLLYHELIKVKETPTSLN